MLERHTIRVQQETLRWRPEICSKVFCVLLAYSCELEICPPYLVTSIDSRDLGFHRRRIRDITKVEFEL